MKKHSKGATPDGWTSERCNTTVTALRDRLTPLRDGRVGPDIVGLVRMEEGALLRDVASIERAADRVEVRPHGEDAKSVQAACRSLVREGLMAHVTGPGLIAVSAAPGQEERIAAIVGRAAEQARVSVRNHRQAARKRDNVDATAVQLAVDSAIREIDTIAAAKLRCVGR